MSLFRQGKGPALSLLQHGHDPRGCGRAATGKSVATLMGHEDGVTSAQFSPDGTRIVTVSNDKKMRMNPDGELETVKPDDWLALREKMRAGAGQDTPYLRILRRFVPE
jgi:WD40 repeat protein